jgi:CelD/BcsL family acetyltransferase involved in cellulose biosynthesis
MNITLSRDGKAWELLRNQPFGGLWRILADSCPWATAFQEPEFVMTWYESYEEQYVPLVVSNELETGRLGGLLLLAIQRDSGEIVVAGAHQAEYQVWLSSPDDEGLFITSALGALKEQFPNHSLVFRYIPSGTPIHWAQKESSWSKYTMLEPWRRPIVKINYPAFVKGYLAQKYKRRSTKSYFNQLRKYGDLRFERLNGEVALSGVLDELIRYYDSRQMAMHGDAPFRGDEQKKSFHLAMMREANLLHVTVLRAGERIVSSQFGIASKSELILAMPIFSPCFADQSPITLHYLLLVEKALEEGYQILDMTPGESGFKDRFATEHEQVHILRVFFSSLDQRHLKTKLALEAAVRSVLRRMNVSPARVRERFDSFRKTFLRLRLLAIPKLVGNRMVRIGKWIHSKDESRAYLAFPADFARLENPSLMRKDCLDDLMDFAPVELWQDKQTFLSESLRRIERKNHSYTRVEKGRLAHFGWMNQDQREAVFPEVGQRLQLPEGTAVLYDFYTDPPSRGNGLYKASMRQILHDAASVASTKRMFIAVLADNTASRQAIEALGFAYSFSLFRSIFFGRVRTWTSPLPEGWQAEAISKQKETGVPGEE